MQNPRKDLPVRPDRNGDVINISVEELDALWGQFIESDNDRQPGEFTRAEVAELWGIPNDTAYDRLELMVSKGLLSKRAGRQMRKKVMFYKLNQD